MARVLGGGTGAGLAHVRRVGAVGTACLQQHNHVYLGTKAFNRPVGRATLWSTRPVLPTFSCDTSLAPSILLSRAISHLAATSAIPVSYSLDEISEPSGLG